MDPVAERTKIVEGGATRLVKGEKPNRQSPFNNRTSVAIAAIIAAEARMYMTPYRMDPTTAYTDTDSIITNYKPDPAITYIGNSPGSKRITPDMIDPTEFGKFKYEGEVKNFAAARKKGYGYERNGVKIAKVAGAPENTITHDQLQKILKGESITT